MKYKNITGPIRKEYTSAAQIIGDRQAKFIFSSNSVDRDYDVITQTGIDLTHFKRNPVAYFQHDHDSIPIGKCISVGIEDGNLVGVIEFVPANNPAVGAKAEGLFQLCAGGFLNTVSIGFIPKSIEYPDGERLANDGANIVECEMVEISLVGIPSNRDALIQSVSMPMEQPVMEPEVQIIQAQPSKVFRAARLKRILAAMN